MTTVVTGASGFVGINLIKRLIEEGNQVRALDYFPYNELKLKGLEWIKCDVTNRDELQAHLDSDVDAVYHLAGVVGVKNYLNDPLKVIDVNFESTRYIVESAKRHDFTLVYASTSEIYGKNPNVPWQEDDDRVLGSTRKDRWVYSTSKALSEHLLFAESRIHGIRSIIVRFFNLYGPYQKPVNVVPKMITSLIRGEKIAIYDSGLQTRCFTYINDATDALLKLVSSKSIKNDVFNIGSNKETSILELSKEILTLFGLDSNYVEKIDTNATLGVNYEDINRRVPGVSKIFDMTGWRAKTELKEGIKKTVQWYKENQNWWNPLY